MMTPEERELLGRAVARMRARIMAVVCAVLGGAAMFCATAIHIPGRRKASTLDIALLEHYLPGYTVSWGGALLGLAYGAIAGAVLGAALGWLTADGRGPGLSTRARTRG